MGKGNAHSLAQAGSSLSMICQWTSLIFLKNPSASLVINTEDPQWFPKRPYIFSADNIDTKQQSVEIGSYFNHTSAGYSCTQCLWSSPVKSCWRIGKDCIPLLFINAFCFEIHTSPPLDCSLDPSLSFLLLDLLSNQTIGCEFPFPGQGTEDTLAICLCTQVCIWPRLSQCFCVTAMASSLQEHHTKSCFLNSQTMLLDSCE